MRDGGEISIRRAGPDDAEALAGLAARVFHATFAASNDPADMAEYLAGAFGPARQLAEIAAPGASTLLAVRDGPIGFAQLRGGPPPGCVTTPDPIEIWRFYLDPAWHGRGVARRLMDAALAEAAARGAGSAWLGVWEHNARAIAFYRKFGFVDVGSHDFRLGRDLQTDRIMALILPAGRR